MELTLKDRKLINNGGIPLLEQRLEDKISSTAIPLEGTTGLSTLTDRKYISNLPKYSVGKVVKSINAWGNKDNAMFGSNAGAVMSAAPAAIDFVGSIASGTKYNKTADDLLQDAGSAEGNIGGVSYQTQNEINAQEVAALEHAENKANTIGLMGKGASLGASIGSVAGPVGGLIGGAVGAIGGLVGGLFGGGKRHAAMRRRIAEAQDKALRQNDFSRNGALTSVLQLNYAREYGDTESQSLYGFANGKSTWSAAGSVGLGANARVSNGEIIANKYTGEMFRVPGLPNNKDGKLAFIRPSDTIISNKYGLSDYVASTGDLEGGEAMQGMIMKSLGKKGYKNGKLPGFAWGLPEWSNLLGNAAGYFTAKADKAKIDADSISRPNTYLSNANAPLALYILGQQQENPYAIMPDLYNTYAKGMYALSNNGGLSGGQRALARLSAMNNLTANAAKMQLAAQAANIGHRQTYADAMLRYGAMDALNRMAALQHDYNAYNQAHGAKQLMSNQRQTDAMNYLLNGVKGNNDLYMWRKMMDNWDRDYNANHPSKTQTYPSFGIDTATRNYISGVKPDEELDFWDEFKRFGRIPTASSYVPNYQNIPVPNFSFPKSIKTRKKSIKRK